MLPLRRKPSKSRRPIAELDRRLAAYHADPHAGELEDQDPPAKVVSCDDYPSEAEADLPPPVPEPNGSGRGSGRVPSLRGGSD